MKINVDLTQNRFFSSNTRSNRNILTFRPIINKKIPLVFMRKNEADDDIDLERQLNALIIAGNKETRAKIKFYKEINSSDYCDCCGKLMNLKPWDVEFGLCHTCYNKYLKRTDRCIWRDEDNE